LATPAFTGAHTATGLVIIDTSTASHSSGHPVTSVDFMVNTDTTVFTTTTTTTIIGLVITGISITSPFLGSAITLAVSTAASSPKTDLVLLARRHSVPLGRRHSVPLADLWS
jgi:hypothetical protein